METSTRYQETVGRDTSDVDSFHPRVDPADRAQEADPSQVLPLPAPPDACAPGGSGSSTQLGLGETVFMDHLGPMVVGEDGTLSRIANWDKLTAREQEVALRRLTARNRERLHRLRGEAAAAARGGLTAATGPAAAGPTVAGYQQHDTAIGS